MQDMSSRSEIIRLLSDGSFHSGTEVGRALGISRAAVCKAIKNLSMAGLDIHRLPGRGYRLTVPLSLLDGDTIRRLVANEQCNLSIEVFDVIDSTSAHLIASSRSGSDIAGRVCLAETQKAGRGRRGRQWVATPYQNILMSVGWRFEEGPAALAGLSLAAGVTVAEALVELGIEGISLKWPNDVLSRGRKVAGLLIEMQGEAAGPTAVVLGIGVNVRIDSKDSAMIDQPWTDMATILGAVPDRNIVAATLLRHVARMFANFAVYRFADFRDRWEMLDAFIGKGVRIIVGENVLHGTVIGIDNDGGLIVENEGGRRTFHAGEISLRGT